MELINPATGRALRRDARLERRRRRPRGAGRANAAFQTLEAHDASQRSSALSKIADVLEAHAEEFVAVEAENCGKIIARHDE